METEKVLVGRDVVKGDGDVHIAREGTIGEGDINEEEQTGDHSGKEGSRPFA